MSAYLDHAASTPVRPAALQAMLPWLSGEAGNPSGAHRAARAARRAVDDARDAVAELAGARPGEVVFTSGGTEADNLALFGVVGAGTAAAADGASAPPFVAVSRVEHHAVLEAAERLGGRLIDVDGHGRLDLRKLDEVLADALPALGEARRGRHDDGAGAAGVVSVQLVNNEVGTVQPVAAVAERVRARHPGLLVHTDAVQAATWLDLAEHAAEADLVSLSAHKFGGPKGVGALIVRRGVELQAQLVGGGQERGRRSGTPNVAGIVGMGAAAAEALATRKATVDRVAALRDRLLDGLARRRPSGWRATVGPGDDVEVVPGVVHLCVADVESEALLFLLDQDGVCASGGSSCSSGAVELSHVLDAMAVDPRWGRGALRLSLGWSSTSADVDVAVEAVSTAVQRLQGAAR